MQACFPSKLVLLQTAHDSRTPGTSTINHRAAECAPLRRATFDTLNQVGCTRLGDGVPSREILRRVFPLLCE